MAHAYSTNALLTKKFKRYDFTGDWEKSVGKPGIGATWLVWGESTNGKSSFVIQLMKYYTQFGRILYNPMEEGFSCTTQDAWRRFGMNETGKKIIIGDKIPIDDLYARLKKKKSPEIVVIDSVDYSLMKKAEYVKFKDSFRNKTLIFISHSDGKKPASALGKFIEYDVDIKIHVKKYVAFINGSRHGGEKKPFVIWKEEAEKYWKDQI